MKKVSIIFVGVCFVVLLMGQAGYGTMVANYTAWQNEYTAADAQTLALWNFNADQITTVTGGHAASVKGTNPNWWANNQDTATANPSDARFISGGKFGGGFENYGGTDLYDRARPNGNGLDLFPSGADPSLSVECWVKFDSLTGAQYLIDKKGSDTTSFGGYYIEKSADGRLWFSLGDGTQNIRIITETTANGGLAWEIDQWYHIAGTWDADDDTARLYRDGVEVGSKQSLGSSIVNISARPVNIGNRATSPYGALNGVIDDLRISDVAYQYVVPEPATMIILGLGGVMMLIRRK